MSVHKITLNGFIFLHIWDSLNHLGRCELEDNQANVHAEYGFAPVYHTEMLEAETMQTLKHQRNMFTSVEDQAK